MAGPAFDALEKYKKDGTLPEKLTITKSTLYLPDSAKEELEKKKNMGYCVGSRSFHPSPQWERVKSSVPVTPGSPARPGVT